ncbi:MAG: lysoplasmalogenase [Flavobacteriales bacterium]|nr:lysoplasmalogenase [Flavobacteriales bacterium]
MLEYICKPAMLVILSSWFFFNSRRYGDRFTLMIQAGLFFSLIGDIALMFQHMDEFYFLIGLGAFLIAQLCYAIAFLRNITEVGGTEGLVVGGGIAVGLALFAVVFSWILLPRLDEGLSIPVLCYVITITCMGMLAAFRYTRTFLRSFWMVMSGALLFIISDSALATNRFLEPFDAAPVIIIVTYAAAQFLIAAGALVHVLDPDSIRRKQALET